MSPSHNKATTVADIFPELAEELEQLLNSVGESALAAQIPSLKIVDRCRCGDDFCAQFYTQPKPTGAYGPGARSVPLEPVQGMLIVDAVDNVIAAVEVLYRDDIRKKLLEIFP
jgi:hypothetical protein